MEIRKILVANRGEIALRIMRSAKEMGIKTVAVYSEPDKNAPFVRFADQSFALGGFTSAESYLKGDLIIAIAKENQVDAIHPGYGFLSENDHFAQQVADAGMSFIGPSPHSIRVMGNKLSAKEAVSHFNIPMVPGSAGAISSAKEAIEIASKVGYPILIKASSGGGGKGMRVVWNDSEMEEQMTRAISEATASFGDGSVFVEKFITSPKHIEIQVIGDQHGNLVHLFERDCSLQRRHQKVIEEAPSAFLDEALREKMGKAAILVAKSANYHSTGTVEFIMDEKKNFYFLEMNTRLQVEHPVTEQITGLDLVKEQIKIAEGKALSFKQEDLKIMGHAIEIRVCAEDPFNNFLPDIGKLELYKRPNGPGIRIDDGFEEGMEIPIFYDPMIAKLICHGSTREEAIERTKRAIEEFQIAPVATTLDFCSWVLGHELFLNGLYGTNFAAEKLETYKSEASKLNEDLIEPLSMLADEMLYAKDKLLIKANKIDNNPISLWKINRLK